MHEVHYEKMGKKICVVTLWAISVRNSAAYHYQKYKRDITFLLNENVFFIFFPL